MKNLYKCERCGKVYESIEDCERCESHHYVFRNATSWYKEGLDSIVDGMAEYKEGQEEPDKITVWFDREYWDAETSEYKHDFRCGKYKLVSSFEAPLVIDKED